MDPTLAELLASVGAVLVPDSQRPDGAYVVKAHPQSILELRFDTEAHLRAWIQAQTATGGPE